jgi:hypothetical protein
MIKKRLEYGLLLLAVIVFHIFLVDYLSFFVLIFFLALPVVSLLVTLLISRGIVAKLEVESSSIQKSETLPIQLKIKNTSFLPCRIRVELVIRNELLQEEIRSTFFITTGYRIQTVEQTLSSKYCGKLDCHIKELRIYDYLGLLSFHKKADDRKSCVFVLPFVYPLMQVDMKINQYVENNESLQVRTGDNPSEIFDIREYRDGDRLSRILWKLSSKHDQLLVKDLGLPISNNVLLLFDLNGGNEELDGLFDTLNSVSCFLLENQIIHEIGWYDTQNEGFVHTEIVKKDDLNMVLNSTLSTGRTEHQPLALMNYGNVYDSKRYAEVIYLCSEISPDCITLLCEKMPANRVLILLVVRPATLQNMDISLAAALGVNLKVVDSENIEQSLSELVL